MDIVDKILLEFRYRLPAGYPRTHDDFKILGEVLTEMTDFDIDTINQIVERSKLK
jgi:hypothetical protein